MAEAALRRRSATVPIAVQLQSLLTTACGGPLPVRLRAWDGSESGPHGVPTVVLRGPAGLRRLFWHPGELGAAQAYIAGDIDIEGDLLEAFSSVIHVLRARGVRPWMALRTAALALPLAARLGALGRPPVAPRSQAQQHGRLHSRLRDRDAIHHHYDLSNEFYATILDERMAYSCAYWNGNEPDMTLEQAQVAKLDLVCRKLGLKEGMLLLDSGCGWGSLTIHAARHYGARVVAVTLSREQLRFARARVEALGLDDRVDIRLQDYRDVHDGGFDAVASIEMGEHVGRNQYPAFLSGMHARLRPGGRLLIQQMSRGRRNPGGGPFIENFIAPDMHMRPVGDTVALIERGGFEVVNVEGLRQHYSRTVADWLQRFEAATDALTAMVGEEVVRVWRLYLVGGLLTFRDGRMGVDQILAVRTGIAGARDPSAPRSKGKPSWQ